MGFLKKRIHGIRGNAAHVAGVAGDHHVALDAPGGAPAVLDEPVVDAVVRAVADDQHGMIDDLIGGAQRLRVDAASVGAERRVTRVDAHRDRSDRLQRAQQGHLVATRQIGSATIVGNRVVHIEAARVVAGRVRIGDGALDATLVGNLCPGGGHPAAIATDWVRAVDQVLLGERRDGHGAVVELEHLALERTGGREGPARAALTLVLDRRHIAQRGPVQLDARICGRGDCGGGRRLGRRRSGCGRFGCCGSGGLLVGRRAETELFVVMVRRNDEAGHALEDVRSFGEEFVWSELE